MKKSITSVGEEKAICLLSFTSNYVVSARRGVLFLWVLGMGCVILLLHFLSLPYYYLTCNIRDSSSTKFIKMMNLGRPCPILRPCQIRSPIYV